jgi:hypothetical protein
LVENSLRSADKTTLDYFEKNPAKLIEATERLPMEVPKINQFGPSTRIVETTKYLDGFAKGEFEIIDAGVKILNSSELSAISLSGEGRIFNHFTDIDGASGITGIDKNVLETMEIGEGIVINEIKFGKGQNPFLSEGNVAGDIFVTDMPANISEGKLNQIGVFGDKQNWVISFSESDAFFQNAKVNGVKPERGISSMPGESNLRGKFILQRTK